MAKSSTTNMFQQLLPRLKDTLKNRGLQYKLRGPLRDCYNTTPCQSYLMKAANFWNGIETIYPKINTTEEFLLQRPDFYFGRLLSMFYDNFAMSNLTIPCLQTMVENNLKSQIANLVRENFNVFLDNNNTQSCFNTLEKIKNSDYDTFIEIVKLSQIETGPLSPNLTDILESKYVNLSALPIQAATQRPAFLATQVGMIPFCQTVPQLSLSTISATQPLQCSQFKPVMTAKGLCQSYNSLSMAELYKPNRCIIKTL